MSLSLLILAVLLGLTVLCLALERAGHLGSPWPVMRRDFLRESLFVSQYGQGACLAVVILLIVTLDPARRGKAAGAVLAGAALAFATSHGLKRVFGRSRPGRHPAGGRDGAFLGPGLKRGSSRESFPSSHAASAFAMSATLAALYPQAAAVWWGLAVATSGLRWLLDAHWLSDVLAGSALGLGCGLVAVRMIA